MNALRASYDVVIIGAGVGGLTAAALLSKAGLSVCVLEKEPHVGGYLAGFRRKDFIFDTAIHWLNQYGPTGVITRLFDALGSDHPRAVTQTYTRRYKGKEFNYLLTKNPDELRDQLIAEFPGEKDGLERFFSRSKRIGNSLNSLNSIFRSEATMTTWEKIRGKISLLKVILPFIPLVRFSGEKGLKRGLNKFFTHPRLHKLFASETEVIGCMVPIGWSYAQDFQSPPKGGGQVIPEWLEHLVHYYGNTVITNSTVKQVLLQGDICTGVAFTHRGKDYEVKSTHVIAACDIETLYEKMLPQHIIPAALKQKLRTAELYSSSVTISVALDCPSEQLGFGEELVHLVDETVSFEAHHSGDPLTTEISILAPSVRDKSMAPEGCGTLTLFMPAFMHENNEWHTTKDEHGNYIRGEAYKKLKQEIAEIIIQRVETTMAPGLKNHILFYDVATPVTHWRYTGNKNGTMMGAKPGRHNMQNNIAHYQTPVKNLILGGHWAELGGGVPIAAKAGTNASLLILKKEKPEAFSSLCQYIDGKLSLEDFQKKDCFKPYDNSWVQPLTPAERKRAKKVNSSETAPTDIVDNSFLE